MDGMIFEAAAAPLVTDFGPSGASTLSSHHKKLGMTTQAAARWLGDGLGIAPAPAPSGPVLVPEEEETEAAAPARAVNLVVKWGKQSIELVGLDDWLRVSDVKLILEQETTVPPVRQKLVGLKSVDSGTRVHDGSRLRDLVLRLPQTKVILMGTREDDLLREPAQRPELFDDMDDGRGRFSEWEWRMRARGELVHHGGMVEEDPSSSSTTMTQQRWSCVFSDVFDYEGAPSGRKWEHQTDCNAWTQGAGFDERQVYTTADHCRNAVVRNGTLRLTARRADRDDAAGPRSSSSSSSSSTKSEFTSARLTTRKTARWRYGRVEVCARLTPAKRGLWPAIWLMPTHSRFGAWPNSGEIDVMENVGYEPDVVRASVHTAKNHRRRGNHSRRVASVKDAHDDFHVYALEWTEGELAFFVDGRRYFRYAKKKTPADPDQWPFDEEFHLILNVAVGGTWGGHKGIDLDAFPATMEVAFVKVFQRGPGDFSPKPRRV